MRRIDKQLIVVDKDEKVIDKVTLFSSMYSNHYTIENNHGSVYDGNYNGSIKYKEYLENLKLLCSMLNNGYHVIEIK